MEEEKEKRRNQKEVAKRSRQWQVVGSSDEEDEGSGKDVHDNHEAEADRPMKKRKHDRDEASDDESQSSHSSSSSSSSSSGSSSDSSRSDSRKKKDKDRKKHSKSSKKSKKKHKKEKKSRKHKKDKKSHKSSSGNKSVAVNQAEYGKYGLIKEEHYFQKQREFEVYMSEVKGVDGVLSLGKREIMQHFKSYIEDYNTCSMPHEKFYSYERWEIQEYQRNKERQQRQQQLVDNDYTNENAFNGSRFVNNDEEIVRQERKRMKGQEEQREFELLRTRIAGDKTLQQDMKRQDTLKIELQQAYKRGDTVAVKRLEKLLTPAEPAPVVKHPWK